MRLGGRLAAAIEVLEDIGGRHRPVADALKDWGLSHRFAGGGDRAAIGNIVYDALRHKRSAGCLLGEDTPPLLSAGELQALAERRPEDAPEAVRADIPDWCEPLFERAFGAEWVAEGAALATRPPLDIRANTLQSD